jgi:hypothetical protein
MIMLVSNIVPYIDAYRKSNIAYYYDPDADWETIRRVNRFVASRETNETAIGFLEQFCDVDVTKDIQKYENVIYSGLLLPKKLNYAKQNIYLMYAPEYDEKGNKATEDELYAKLNLRGFSNLGKNFFPAGKYHENGCKDKLHSPTLEKNFFASGKTIKGAEYPLRKAFFPTLSNKEYVIGARNKKGNILINSIWTSFVNQAIGKAIIEQDLDYFGWTKRNCPQVNGKDKIVAVAFRESRTAVIDFGQNTQISKINIIIFNGYNGIIRNETITYNKGMKITLAPFNVLVAYGKN